MHELTQVPPSQNGALLGHFLAQAPQFVGVSKSVSQNSLSELVQCPKPDSHELAGIEHLPALHAVGAPARTCGNAAQSATELHMLAGAPPLALPPASLPALAAVKPALEVPTLEVLPPSLVFEPPLGPPALLPPASLVPAIALAPPAFAPAAPRPNSRDVPPHAN
ncbi:MAG TPA: hypothetical protein VFK05_20420 [Polyangiaceae bacterium]|nr:hypothetical protein [Polyangiaceae bacterium]